MHRIHIIIPFIPKSVLFAYSQDERLPYVKRGDESLAIQRVRSKWAKTKVLLRSHDLRQYIPHTKRFNREALQSMIDEYGMIYVKPSIGTYGNGVIRVERESEAPPSYRYQLNTTVHSYSSVDQLYDALRRVTNNKSYIIQKGVNLLKHQKLRFDIRVMVQKNLKNRWESTGVIGRLSHPQKIITNYHSGGKVMTFERLMSEHANASEISSYKRRLKRLGVAVGEQLETAYPNLKELGIDVAIDSKLHPWILEVNTKPHPFVYRKLPDKSVYKKVYRYAVAYGGIKKR